MTIIALNILYVFAFIIIFVMMIVMQAATMLFFALFKATDSRKKKYHRLMHSCVSWLIRHIPGVSVSVVNASGEDFSRPAIVVCNHQSHLDLLALMMLTPNVIFVAKKWVWQNPLYGMVIRYADFISTEDNHIDNAAKIKTMADKGYSTVVFPEGTRSASCKVLRFHRGAFWTAQQLGMDLLPITLYGTGKVMNKRTLLLTPGKIIVNIHERIACDPAVGYDVRAREVRKLIAEQYNTLERQNS